MIDPDWMFAPEDEAAERAASLDKRTIFRNAASGEQWIEDENGERQYINTDLPNGVDFKIIGGQISDAMGNILGPLVGDLDSAGPGYRTLSLPPNKALMDELVGLSILKPSDSSIIKGIL